MTAETSDVLGRVRMALTGHDRDRRRFVHSANPTLVVELYLLGCLQRNVQVKRSVAMVEGQADENGSTVRIFQLQDKLAAAISHLRLRVRRTYSLSTSVGQEQAFMLAFRHQLLR